MKFNRIDENSIRCVISQAEMDEHGIHIDDLMDNREKAETFLRYILQQANEEIDFNLTGNALNVQLSVMPGGDISLMISDNEKSALKNMISEFRRSLQNFRDVLEEKRTALSDAGSLLKELKEIAAKNQIVQKSSDSELKSDDMMQVTVWAEFTSLDQMIRMSKAVPKLHDRPSVLYKHNGIFYLVIDMEDSRQNVADMSFAMAEYAKTLYAEGVSSYDVKEHGTVIIAEDAVNVLAQM